MGTSNTLVTAPERLQTYLENPEGKRLPFSCTLAVLKKDTDIGEVVAWATQSLKSGAGVKLIIADTFKLPEPADLDLELFLDYDHPDWQTPEQPEGLNISKSFDRLPVAGIVPDDSIEGIAAGWRQLFRASGHVTVNLSLLRPRDTVNSDGMLASGPISFARVYLAIAKYRTNPSMFSLLRLFGILNDVILRGGYKKGIITSAIEDTSEYVDDYLAVPLVSLRGSHKKGLILSKHPGERLDTVIEKVNYESMFLQKARPDKLYANVCMGIYLDDRGTCLINRVNLGQVKDIRDIPMAFVEATRHAVLVHHEWRKQQPERANQWAGLATDNQVAIDVMGLSNLLRQLGISYRTLILALNGEVNQATELLSYLAEGYTVSCLEADRMCLEELGIPVMERLHTVEPAQAHSYRTTDAEGYTTARGIWPPFSRIVNRYSQSSTEPVKTYDHGPIEELTPDEHYKLCCGWANLMGAFGRPHSISYDTWEDFTPGVFKKWWDGPLTTLYYNMSKDYNTRGYARKRFVAPDLTTCTSCAD